MSDGQLVVYIVLGLILLLSARKAWHRRMIPRYTAASLHDRMNGVHDYLLLDVRTDGERKLGTIKGSHHLPIQHIIKRMNELEKHKAKEIICFCQTGSRSLTAAVTLKNHGFKVAHLEGGMAEWNFANR